MRAGLDISGRRLIILCWFFGVPIAPAWVMGKAGNAVLGQAVGGFAGAAGFALGCWLWWKLPEFIAQSPGRVKLALLAYLLLMASVAVVTR